MGSDKVHIHEVNRVSMTASTVESSKGIPKTGRDAVPKTGRAVPKLFQRQEGLRQTQVPDHL